MKKIPFHSHPGPSGSYGFSLLEVCLALILLGLVAGAAMQVYGQHQDQMAIKTTENNMRVIVKALNNFAQTNNRLPCPTNPGAADGSFGFESGVAAATIAGGRPPGNCATGNTSGGVRNGLVPYQSLNIPYETILDGWGRYITYGVSPIFALPNEIFRDEFKYNEQLELVAGPDNADDGDVQIVHEKCREAGWVNAQDDPVNGPKARFCCAFNQDEEAAASDIIIQNRDNGQEVSPRRAANNHGAYSGRMHKILRGGTAPNVYAETSKPGAAGYGQVEAAAFALVSHGSNGSCSFMANDTGNRLNCSLSSASSNEISNGGDRTFFTGMRQNDFDDIVIWMTQFGIMAAGGSNSCNLP